MSNPALVRKAGRHLSPLLLLLVFLFVLTNDFQKLLVSEALVWSVLALSFSILFSAGFISLCQGLVFGVGLFTTANVINLVGSPVAAVLSSLLAGLAFGALIGSLLSNAGRHQIIVATLIINMLGYLAALNLRWLTGGYQGLRVDVPWFFSSPGLAYVTTTIHYLLVSSILLTAYFSRIRLILEAMKSNEGRLELLGYDTRRIRVVLFSVSGALASLSGSLLAMLNGSAVPREMDLITSIKALVWGLVAGSWNPVLVFVSTLLLNLVAEYSKFLLRASDIAYGVILSVLAITGGSLNLSRVARLLKRAVGVG